MKKHYMILFPKRPDSGIWVINYYEKTRTQISFAHAKTLILAAVLRNDALITESPSTAAGKIYDAEAELIFENCVSITDREVMDEYKTLYKITYEKKDEGR